MEQIPEECHKHVQFIYKLMFDLLLTAVSVDCIEFSPQAHAPFTLRTADSIIIIFGIGKSFRWSNIM